MIRHFDEETNFTPLCFPVDQIGKEKHGKADESRLCETRKPETLPAIIN